MCKQLLRLSSDNLTELRADLAQVSLRLALPWGGNGVAPSVTAVMAVLGRSPAQPRRRWFVLWVDLASPDVFWSGGGELISNALDSIMAGIFLSD